VKDFINKKKGEEYEKRAHPYGCGDVNNPGGYVGETVLEHGSPEIGKGSCDKGRIEKDAFFQREKCGEAPENKEMHEPVQAQKNGKKNDKMQGSIHLSLNKDGNDFISSKKEFYIPTGCMGSIQIHGA
jgi:hypothetical protein